MLKTCKPRTVALPLILLIAMTSVAHAACTNGEIQYLQRQSNRMVAAAMQMNFEEVFRLELEAMEQLSPTCQATLSSLQRAQIPNGQLPYGGLERPRSIIEGSDGTLIAPGQGACSPYSGCVAY